MKPLRRILFSTLTSISLLLAITVAVLWVRAQTASDWVEWRYLRWLPDKSVASNEIYLSNDQRRMWLDVSWGRSPPYDGNLVWGYYIGADQSGGRPRFRHRSFGYTVPGASPFVFTGVDPGTSDGLSPLRWQTHRRTMLKDGDDHRSIRIGLSYWLATLILLALPTFWLYRYRKFRSAQRRGHCPACGYEHARQSGAVFGVRV